MIERVGVVIPAHNEEELLPACLDAVRDAVAVVDRPVDVVVALDRCTDRSRAVVHDRPWATAVEINVGNVGRARAAGASAVLDRAASTSAERIWLATTDADSLVPVDWLAGQCALADEGWEVVLGTVRVLDWLDHPAETSRRWAAGYQPVEGHPHVHGANLGCSASAYLDAGGWPPVATNEDVALVQALSHRRLIRTATLPVTTSSRRDPRAAGGFGHALRDLAG